MLASSQPSEVDDVRSLLEVFSKRVASLPVEQREEIAGDWQRLHSIVNDLIEEKTHCAQTERDLLQSNQALAESEAKYRALTESIQDGLFSINKDWIITYINQRAARNGGLEPEQLTGRNIWEAFPKLKDTPIAANYQRVMTERTPVQFEMRGAYRDLWYNISIYPAGDGISVYWQDISERKRAESALAESQKRLADFLESTQEHIYALDHQWNYVFANQRYCAVRAINPGDLIGKNYWEVNSRYLGTEIETHLRKAMSERVPVHFRAGGMYSSSWFRLSVYPTQEGVSVFAEDRTDEFRAEQALRENEARYRGLFETMREIFFVCEILRDESAAPIDIRYLEANNACLSMAGRKREEFIGSTYRKLFPLTSTFDTLLAHISQVARTGTSEHFDQFAEAAGRYFEVFAYSNCPGQVAVLFNDITERKQNEAERERMLREIQNQNELLAQIVREAPIGIAVVAGPEHRYELVNEYYLSASSGKGEIIGRTVGEVWAEVADQLVTPLDEVYRSGTIFRAVDAPFHIIRGQSQEEGFFTFTFLPLKNSSGAVERIMILVLETTEQVKALRAIEANQRLMKAVIENAPEGIVVTDAQARVILTNSVADRLYARPIPYQQEFLSHAALEICDPEGHLYNPRDLPVTRSALDGETITNQEMSIRWPDGEVRPLLVNTAPIRDQQNRVTGAVGVFQDMTNIKQTQALLEERNEALRASNEKITQILESIPDGFFSFDREWKMTYVNQRAAEQGGQTQQELVGRVIWEAQPYLIGSNLEAVYRRVMVNRQPETTQFLSSHSGRWFELHVQPWADGISVYSMDITERKRAETELEKAHNELINEHNRLFAVMEALPVGVAILDEKGGKIQSNHAFEEVWGNALPETRSVDDYAAYHAWWMDTGEPVQPEEWASAQAVKKGETIVGQQIEIQRFDGSRGFVLNSGAPIWDAQGQIIGCAVAIVDITKQIQMEARQQEHRTQMEIQQRLLDYRDQERQALARELHDGPVQDLSGVLFSVQFAKEAISDLPMKLELDKIASGLRETVQNLRGMINEMRPPSLIRFGLAKAMNVFLEEFKEKHPEIQLNASLSDDGNCLSEQGRLSLYRIVQEALTNILKHSYAERIDVILNCEDQQVTLEIHDDGKGFPLFQNLIEYSSHGHYGLVGMKERAEAVGAEFQVQSSPGEGTTIRVIVPTNNL